MFSIVEKYKSIKEQWLSKTPKEKWLLFYRIGDFALRLIGVNVFNDNPRSIWTYSFAVAIVSYAVLFIHTTISCSTENILENCLNNLCAGAVLTSV